MQEYVITLHNKEDLDDFYNDMETPGGDLYIPDRAVNVELRRPISRNTHYMLTPEEVIELKQDPRVWDVKSANHIRSAQGSYDGFGVGGTFERDNFIPNTTDKNWGLYKHVLGDDIPSTDLYSGSIADVTGDGSDFFKREVTVNGTRIMAAGAVGGQSAVPDAWIEKIARMYELFLIPNQYQSQINDTLQRNLIRNLKGLSGTWHEGKPTLQRVARGGGGDYTPNFLTDSGIISWNLTNLFDTHVANDMVWYLNSSGTQGDGDLDAGEVIEHIMHTLHMHGLPADDIKLYAYLASDWASGDLYAAMEEAYDAGKWDPSGYNTPSNAWKTDSDAFEVAAKEYLYLLNFCMFEYSDLWDGGSLSPEWTDDMRTEAGIQSNNPLGYAFHNTYIKPVISKPSLTTIRNIFQDGDSGDPTQAGASGYVTSGINWGSDEDRKATPNNYTITASGKNVDVLIVDSVISTTARNHPEFAVNADGTGGSRVQHFNWFSLNSALGYGSNGTYDYSDDGETHGVHVAGTAAGNTQGWARDANIYNIQPFGQNHGSGELDSLKYWDYIRQWHNNKTINSETGRRNPTISNHSYSFQHGRTSGTYRQAEDDGSADIVSGIGVFNYRGSIFDKYGDDGSDLSDAELRARGIIIDGNGDFSIPFWSASMQADVDDAADDGIIFVTAAGNSQHKITKSGDQDYNNLVYWRVGGNQYADNDPSHRPVSVNGGSHPNAINVGSLDITKNDKKADFSNCGNAVNIHGAGYGIVSAWPDATGHFLDSRNTSFSMQKQSGTSMAAPQVCGVLALLAESNPGLTQAEAKAWLEANGTANIMYDSGTDDSQDSTSLQGSLNKILRWVNQRPETGMSFPKVNAKVRPTSGTAYPRPRIRRRG